MDSYSSMLERTRAPQLSLQRFAVISIFEKLRSAPPHLDSNSNPGREAITQCLHSCSPSVVDQSVRELCRLVKESKFDLSRGFLELQSSLEGCDSRFVNVFVKGLGFLVRHGFQNNSSSFRFNSSETHPFVKVLSCRREVQFELVQQVLLLMAQNKRLGMVEVCEFLRPFLNHSILRIPVSNSFSMFVKDLISSMASMCCSSPLEAMPVFKLLVGCLNYFPCKTADEFRYIYYFVEYIVDAYVVVLRHLVGMGLAREKFLSLRKGTKNDIATILEEELHNARSAFEQARFNLVTALSNVEAKKRFEFLEAVSGTMDAHLRYFKQGYELLNQMEPYISQVLTYAQQSRERSNYEQAALNERMQEYKRQIDRESRRSSNGSNGSPNGDGIQAIGRSSHKMIEAVMQSAAKGKVQTIRQGYLSKRSSNLRGDWKRRFFVLDSKGMLYYYRKQCSKPSGSGSQLSGQRNSSELGSGLLSRWLSSHYHGGVHDEKSVAHHTVNLLTSTIKVDADQSDLRFCFRIISPTKNYTLQAESALDQMDWIEKITGVIASLLSSQAPERCLPTSPMGSSHHRSASESSSFESSDFDHTAAEEYASERLACGHHERTLRSSQQQRPCVKGEKPIDVLRKVCGNDRCADCGAPEPDWASLNLGVLVCIECSGVHRNLGVHISKVRSLTLDVKVWEPSVISLFQSLGNTFANSVWEELLQSRSGFQVDLVPTSLYKSGKPQVYFISKPNHADSISVKEKFIHAKYEDKLLVRRPRDNHTVAQQIWEAVRINDKKAVYRHIVNSEADVNSVHEQVYCKSLTLAKVMLLQDQTSIDHNSSFLTGESPAKTLNSSNLAGTSEGHAMEDLEGCSLLHLACETADIGMLELLLQYGANINASDLRGQTPLHRCILGGKATFFKLLLSRGADPRAVNGEGKNPFELAVESNFEDSEVLAVLSYSNR